MSRCFIWEINERTSFWVNHCQCKVSTVGCFCNVHAPIFGFSWRNEQPVRRPQIDRTITKCSEAFLIRWNMAIMMNYFLQIIFNLNLSQMSSFYMQKHDCCKGFFLSILIKIKIFEGSMQCVKPIKSQAMAVQNSIENPELLNQKANQCLKKLVSRSSSIWISITSVCQSVSQHSLVNQSVSRPLNQ